MKERTRKLTLSAMFVYGAWHDFTYDNGTYSADWQYASANAHSGFSLRAYLRLAIWSGGWSCSAVDAFCPVRDAAALSGSHSNDV